LADPLDPKAGAADLTAAADDLLAVVEVDLAAGRPLIGGRDKGGGEDEDSLLSRGGEPERLRIRRNGLIKSSLEANYG